MDKLPLDIRYLITIVSTTIASILYQRGWIGNQASFISNTTNIVVALIPVGVWLYARFIRPSAPAMEVAKLADKVIAGEVTTQTVVKTPAGVPNVIVKPEK